MEGLDHERAVNLLKSVSGKWSQLPSSPKSLFLHAKLVQLRVGSFMVKSVTQCNVMNFLVC